MIVEQAYWMYFVSAMVAGIGFGWFTVDIVRLLKTRKRDDVTHDELFGILTGLALSGIGIVGFFRYHLGF